MSYYVYEWVRREGQRAEVLAIVHTAECPNCNLGAGRALNAGRRFGLGRWHGPYPALSAARAAAESITGRALPCGRCAPFAYPPAEA